MKRKAHTRWLGVLSYSLPFVRPSFLISCVNCYISYHSLLQKSTIRQQNSANRKFANVAKTIASAAIKNSRAFSGCAVFGRFSFLSFTQTKQYSFGRIMNGPLLVAQFRFILNWNCSRCRLLPSSRKLSGTIQARYVEQFLFARFVGNFQLVRSFGRRTHRSLCGKEGFACTHTFRHGTVACRTPCPCVCHAICQCCYQWSGVAISTSCSGNLILLQMWCNFHFPCLFFFCFASLSHLFATFFQHT